MTQLLSLAFGNISPLGLSGGATPSTPSEFAFADLLTAPRAEAPTMPTVDLPAKLPFAAESGTIQAPMPESGGAAARQPVLSFVSNAGLSPAAEAPSPGSGAKTQPMPRVGTRQATPAIPAAMEIALPPAVVPMVGEGPIPTAQGSIPAVDSGNTGEGAAFATPPTARIDGGLAPVPAALPAIPQGSAGQPLLSGAAPVALVATGSSTAAPMQAAPKTDLTAGPAAGAPEAAAPEASAVAPMQEAGRRSGQQPGGEQGDGTTRPVVEPVLANGAAQTAQPERAARIAQSAQPAKTGWPESSSREGDRPVEAVDPDSEVVETIELHAREIVHVNLVPPHAGHSDPSPSTVIPRSAAPLGERQPTEQSTRDEFPLQMTREYRPAADAASPRLAPANAPESGPAVEFARILHASSGDVAVPSTEGGAASVELAQPVRSDPARTSAEPVRPMPPVPETVSARPGEIGRQMGVEIARHSHDGRDSLTIRLDPVEMGEIQVRLQFDDRGTMRAHVTAESSVALEMLRRDSGDLARALADAGVRTDAQSFQFEARSQGRGDPEGQQGQHGRPDTPARKDGDFPEAENNEAQSPRHKLRSSSGSLDLFA